MASLGMSGPNQAALPTSAPNGRPAARGREWPRLQDVVRRTGKALALLSCRRYRRGLVHGVAAAIEHSHLAPLDARTVVDAGANRGQFALLAAEIFPRARILAFEPLSRPVKRFRRVLGDEPRVEIHPVGLGSREERLAVNVTARDDCSSLRRVTSAQLDLAAGSRVVGSEWADVLPLTRFLDPHGIARPALLKIDVQGYEREVLDGAAPLLPHFDAVYVEVSFRELYAGQALAGELLDRLCIEGFVLHGVHNLVADALGRPVQADLDVRRPPCRR